MATNDNPIVGGHGYGDTNNVAEAIVMGDINHHYCPPPPEPSFEEARRAGSFVWREAPSIKIAADRDSWIFQFMWNNAPSVAGHQLAEERRTGGASLQATTIHTTPQQEVHPNEKGAAIRGQVKRDMRRGDGFMDKTKEGKSNTTDCDFAISLQTFMRETCELAKRVGSNPRCRKRLCHAEFFSITQENSNYIVPEDIIQWTSYRPLPEWHSDFQESDTRGKNDRTGGLRKGNPSPSRPHRTSPGIGRNISSGSPAKVGVFQNPPTTGAGSARPPGRYPKPSSFKGIQSQANLEDIGDPVINETFPVHKSKPVSPRLELSADIEADILPRKQPRSSSNTTPKPASSGFTMGQATPPASSAARNVNRNRREEQQHSRPDEITERKSTAQTVSGAREDDAVTLTNEAKPQRRRHRRKNGKVKRTEDEE
ncbi:hypothetical protein K469DRAFT_332920 [Zopfia rhizophila CBS 207.26]|uniref:Uncharacterized protein n=1 Tax=Zopfia rhizophila CBS 207.26 TaxID=1314779 RepID=A0A6A6DG47_9PEZI|nr:hypothetical protein K469DRAFT_332920 [Zopfia rhizophila CBS 207.26]